MIPCASCGLVVEGGFCPHHHYAYETENTWAAGNRLVCDFLHRRILRSELDPESLADFFGGALPELQRPADAVTCQ